MDNEHKVTVEKINVACAKGDTEAFLSYLTDDVTWTIIGDENLIGKAAIRQFMLPMGADIPKFTVEKIIAEGDVAMGHGNMEMKGEDGITHPYAYCDIYQFNNDKVNKMTTFVKQTNIKQTN